MAQILVLKINSVGLPEEHNSTSDDITFNSFSVQGGGPTMNTSGLDMNSTDITDIEDIIVENPATSTINQTAGNLLIDDIMAKERNNVMATTGAILFPLVTNVGGEVDSFKVPHIAGVPSATPTFSANAGYLVFDDTNNDMYVWDGAAWDNMNTVESTNSLDNTYVAEVAVAIRDVVYISSADNVSPALGSALATEKAIGFAIAAAAPAANVEVRSEGILTGFAGLTAGSRYFLSAATPGAITATVPVGSGNIIRQVGYAKSATAVHIQIDYLGRRA